MTLHVLFFSVVSDLFFCLSVFLSIDVDVDSKGPSERCQHTRLYLHRLLSLDSTLLARLATPNRQPLLLPDRRNSPGQNRHDLDLMVAAFFTSLARKFGI